MMISIDVSRSTAAGMTATMLAFATSPTCSDARLLHGHFTTDDTTENIRDMMAIRSTAALFPRAGSNGFIQLHADDGHSITIAIH